MAIVMQVAVRPLLIQRGRVRAKNERIMAIEEVHPSKKAVHTEIIRQTGNQQTKHHRTIIIQKDEVRQVGHHHTIIVSPQAEIAEYLQEEVGLLEDVALLAVEEARVEEGDNKNT